MSQLSNNQEIRSEIKHLKAAERQLVKTLEAPGTWDVEFFEEALIKVRKDLEYAKSKLTKT